MENEILVFIMRGLERLAIVAIAGLLIYLGYKLLIQMPDKTDSEGKVVLPGGVSIYLSRIGPGAFLALFGSIILIYSVTTQVSTKTGGYLNDTIVTISYMNQLKNIASEDQEIIAWEESYLEMDIESLNQLHSIVNEMIESGEDKQLDFLLLSKLQPGITRIKGMMMLRHWKEEWGDRITFYNWIKNGASAEVPPGIERAVEIYYRN